MRHVMLPFYIEINILHVKFVKEDLHSSHISSRHINSCSSSGNVLCSFTTPCQSLSVSLSVL